MCHVIKYIGALWLDSIAASLFGNMTVETGEILIINKEYQKKKIKIIILILKRLPYLIVVTTGINQGLSCQCTSVGYIVRNSELG